VGGLYIKLIAMRLFYTY